MPSGVDSKGPGMDNPPIAIEGRTSSSNGTQWEVSSMFSAGFAFGLVAILDQEPLAAGDLCVPGTTVGGWLW